MSFVPHRFHILPGGETDASLLIFNLQHYKHKYRSTMNLGPIGPAVRQEAKSVPFKEKMMSTESEVTRNASGISPPTMFPDYPRRRGRRTTREERVLIALDVFLGVKKSIIANQYGIKNGSVNNCLAPFRQRRNEILKTYFASGERREAVAAAYARHAAARTSGEYQRNSERIESLAKHIDDLESRLSKLETDLGVTP